MPIANCARDFIDGRAVSQLIVPMAAGVRDGKQRRAPARSA